MEEQEFRTEMMNHVRGFDKWARNDMADNPSEWREPKSFREWFEMFKDYVG